MAKTLKPLLKDIADAIREKKQTTEQINAQNFPAEIRSIETGGGTNRLNEYLKAKITEITVEDTDGVVTIPERTAYFFNDLVSVNLSDTVKNIGSSCFVRGGKLTNINFGKSLEKIDSNSLSYMAVEKLEFPSSLIDIKANFSGCDNLGLIIFNTTATHALTISPYAPWFNSGHKKPLTVKIIGPYLPQIQISGNLFQNAKVEKVIVTTQTAYDQSKTANQWSILYNSGKVVLEQ